jgi:hypothetical protein
MRPYVLTHALSVEFVFSKQLLAYDTIPVARLWLLHLLVVMVMVTVHLLLQLLLLLL